MLAQPAFARPPLACSSSCSSRNSMSAIVSMALRGLGAFALLRGCSRRLSSVRASAVAAPDGDASATVYCVGRNYVEHIKELPGLLDIPSDLPTTPMIFMKTAAAIVHSGQDMQLPPWSTDVQHELELAIQLGPDLRPIAAAVAIDLTARDVQAQLKRQGHPWALSKSFKGSCPLGSAFSLDGIDVQQLDLTLEVNGSMRQSASTALMIFKVDEIVAYLKQYFPVRVGDWVLTGTPEGVAALQKGDSVRAAVGYKGKILSEGSWQVSAGPAEALDAWKQRR